MSKMLLGLGLAGLLSIPVATSAAFHPGAATQGSRVLIASASQNPISAQVAGLKAVAAVGGGSVTRVSTDHYLGQAIYDVHVLASGSVFDVKVSMDGTILLKKLSTEQPSQTLGTTPSTSDAASAALGPSTNSTQTGGISAAQAAQIAAQAVGGGSVRRASADHAGGVAVWDVHVLSGTKMWDVKVVASNGAVLQKKLSNEQPGSPGAPEVTPGGTAGTSTDQSGREGSSSQSKPSQTWNGVVLDQKLMAPPAQFASYVAAAISQVQGVSLKWVKFQATDRGDYQMNIKIHLQQGTTKVKDLFSASGQLLSQSTSQDN